MTESDQSEQDPHAARVVDGSPACGSEPITAHMTEKVMILSASTQLRDAAIALRRADVSFAAVGDGVAFEGVVSERDLVRAVAHGLDVDDTSVAAVESDSLKWALSTSTVADVAQEMLDTNVRHILVCDPDGALAGVVSMRDLLAAYVREGHGAFGESPDL